MGVLKFNRQDVGTLEHMLDAIVRSEMKKTGQSYKDALLCSSHHRETWAAIERLRGRRSNEETFRFEGGVLIACAAAPPAAPQPGPYHELFMGLVSERAASGRVSATTAFRLVARDNPEVYRRYLAEAGESDMLGLVRRNR